jgi:hypothetical protein
MKLTIITADNAVYKDGVSYSDLNLSVCDIPSNISALQWQDTAGWVEDKSAMIQNKNITELPTWANACLTKWDEAKAAEEAAMLAAQQAAILAAQQAAQQNTPQEEV